MLRALQRTVVVLAIVTVLIGLARAPARAGAGDPVTCTQNPTNPSCDVVAATPGESGGGGGSSLCHDALERAVPCYIEGKGWLGYSYCWWQPATGENRAFIEGRYDRQEPPKDWYVGTCGDYYTGEFTTEPYFMVMDTNPGVALLAQQAVRRIVLPAPSIRLNPAPPAAQLVFVPTWLWLDASSWGSRSATASVPGLSVTATATPVSVTWSMGDGGSQTCKGPGTPWGGGDPMAASPDCGHLYTHLSGTGVFTVRATITWRVSWVGGATSGTEPALTSAATADIRVAESPTVITGGV